ncbi:MAG: FAD-dependent oxidoreductase [Planctomycetaceae bacterium]|nr:FAD-dependent oxidoreductase [Planctomycetaceae bacterium]
MKNRRKFIKSTLAIGALSLLDGKAFGQSNGESGQKNKAQDKATYAEPQKTIPVYGSFDVIVVGGGPAGWAAALASTRNKARTLVIERFSFFGGTATASLMLNINGFRNQKKPDDLQTSKGIAEELILNLKELGGLGTSTAYDAQKYPTTKGNLTYSYPIDGEKTKYMMLKLLHDAGANILFHTLFADTIMEGNNVAGIIIENKSGRQAIFGKVVIDASGDADVAYHAGVPYWQAKKEDNHLGNGLMYRVSMNPDSARKMSGIITNRDLTLWGPGSTFDGTNADEITRNEIDARLAVFEHFRQNQQKQSPLLDDAYITEVAPLMGIRQTRFIKGLYTTSNDDALKGQRFDDSIAMSACPIISYYGYRRYLEHTGYEIPYRCLLPQNAEGLIVAGRCISSDQQSYESWRAMSPVMCIGQAAGTAAALCVETKKSPKEVDVSMLRDRLINQGAEIGQNKKD